MPLFEQDIKIISSYRVCVEAEDEYEADEKIASMTNAQIVLFPRDWTERDDSDQLPHEVR